jgi:putative membrane protein
MNIEGILEAEQLRDYLYSKMRGARSLAEDGTHGEQHPQDEALTLLREIRDLLRKRS